MFAGGLRDCRRSLQASVATSRRSAAKLTDVITGASVGGLAGGVTQGGFDTSNLGSFSETLSFDVESSNSSLYDQVIGSVTFTIEGDIVASGPSVPEPGTLGMLASGFGMLFFAARRRRRMQ